MNIVEAIWLIDERTDGIYNDLKAFLYVRIKHLQHGSDNIGGGNVTQAIALFAVLNFLGKIQYFLDKGTALNVDGAGDPVIIEERAFIHLIKKLDENNIKLGLPSNKSDILKLVWHGFRNKLSHVAAPEDGKQTMVYVIEDPSGTLTVSAMLKSIKNKEPFEHDGNDRNWKVNVDILLARIPDIKKMVSDQIKALDQTTVDFEILKKVIG